MSNHKNDSLGTRCKLYEESFRTLLPIRMPVILRLDGKAFHSYTKGCEKPFDENLVSCMNDTALYLCKNIQNAVFAYVQSDEISILLINYKELNTESWHGNNTMKMCSVAAGLASSYFTCFSDQIFDEIKLATFDCRAFVVPKEDVNNVFLWRQQDATRNSVQMVARSYFSQKELHKKNISDLQKMLITKGVNWNDLPTWQKHGRCIIKQSYLKDGVERSKWIVDDNIPIFSHNKEYINSYVNIVPKE